MTKTWDRFILKEKIKNIGGRENETRRYSRNSNTIKH